SILFGSALSSISAEPADAPNWDNLYQRAHEAYRDGKVSEAERLLRSALICLGDGKGTFRERANTFDALALICTSDGRTAQAQAFLEKSLALRQQNLWPSHPKVLDGEHQLAILYQDAGSYDKAEALLRQELAQREKLLPGN